MPGTWGWLPRRQDPRQHPGHDFTLLQERSSRHFCGKRPHPTLGPALAEEGNRRPMKPPKASLALTLAGSLALSFAALAHADSNARVSAATAPAGTDPRLRVALQNSVAQRLTEAGLTRSLEGYSLSPSLVQLRSYIEPGQKHARLVCVVGFALSSDRGVVADV